jgi:glycosidase
VKLVFFEHSFPKALNVHNYALILPVTYVGVPDVYYGDEVGVKGSGEWKDSRWG